MSINLTQICHKSLRNVAGLCGNSVKFKQRAISSAGERSLSYNSQVLDYKEDGLAPRYLN